MDNLKRVLVNSIMSALLFILLGAFLLFKPETTINLISYILGTIIIVMGVFSLAKFIKNKDQSYVMSLNLVYSIICFVLGMLLVLNPNAIASLIPLVLGIWIVFSSAFKVQYAIQLKRFGSNRFTPTLILSFLELVCGVILIFNPFEGAIVITRLIGICIIAYSIIDVIEAYIIKKHLSKFTETIVDAQIEEIKK